MNPQNADVYFRRYGRCGFNFFRFSQQNCSYVQYGDLDHDGLANNVDADDDNDGVVDKDDAFPLEPEEWADADHDLIGDNLDADTDGDGVADDRNHNGTPDCEELDFDGDGWARAKAVPWDAFPLDSREWRDTDGDGLGDNADTDDDGDGWSDAEEAKAGTDPLDRLSFPAGVAGPTKAATPVKQPAAAGSPAAGGRTVIVANRGGWAGDVKRPLTGVIRHNGRWYEFVAADGRKCGVNVNRLPPADRAALLALVGKQIRVTGFLTDKGGDTTPTWFEEAK